MPRHQGVIDGAASKLAGDRETAVGQGLGLVRGRIITGGPRQQADCKRVAFNAIVIHRDYGYRLALGTPRAYATLASPSFHATSMVPRLRSAAPGDQLCQEVLLLAA